MSSILSKSRLWEREQSAGLYEYTGNLRAKVKEYAKIRDSHIKMV